MGLFKKRVDDPRDLERLRSEIASMSARLDAADAVKRQLGRQVDQIVTRLDTPLAPAPEAPPAPLSAPSVDRPPPPEPPATVDPDEFAALRACTKRIAQRLDDLDVRITAISTELANQITELGGELASLDRPTNGHDPADGLIDELRDAQTRLANEQARYQIAFRQDLADLAELLKHA